jgi:hypothetical protein
MSGIQFEDGEKVVCARAIFPAKKASETAK